MLEYFIAVRPQCIAPWHGHLGESGALPSKTKCLGWQELICWWRASSKRNKLLILKLQHIWYLIYASCTRLWKYMKSHQKNWKTLQLEQYSVLQRFDRNCVRKVASSCWNLIFDFYVFLGSELQDRQPLGTGSRRGSEASKTPLMHPDGQKTRGHNIRQLVFITRMTYKYQPYSASRWRPEIFILRKNFAPGNLDLVTSTWIQGKIEERKPVAFGTYLGTITPAPVVFPWR